LRVSRVADFLLRPVIGLTPYRLDARRRVIAAWAMNTWLIQLAALDRAFPIRIRSVGADAVHEAKTNAQGMVICSVHLPLINLILRPLVDLGLPPTAVVADQAALVEGKSALWGTLDGLPGLATDANVLLKVRNILRRGGSVAALIDTNLGDNLNPNMFRLVRSVGARVVFALAELLPSGEIQIEYFAPPDPFCRSNESVLANLQVLQSKIDHVLKTPARPRVVPISPVCTAATDPAASVRLSELDSSS
jgi:lauroyl/myristoyl acyltransferase